LALLFGESDERAITLNIKAPSQDILEADLMIDISHVLCSILQQIAGKCNPLSRAGVYVTKRCVN
jgi:hypothetical protein